MSTNSVASINSATKTVTSWINDYEPDIIVSEDPKSANRKGVKQRAILEQIACIAESNAAMNILVVRRRVFKNRYMHAAALAERFRSVKHLVPKEPPIWMPEPRKMIYFEALAMAEQVFDQI